jgi:hypothetical protein
MAMAGSTVSAEIDEIRAVLLVQVIRREYLEQMLEKAKLLESAHGADYPHNISRALQDLVYIESQKHE